MQVCAKLTMKRFPLSLSKMVTRLLFSIFRALGETMNEVMDYAYAAEWSEVQTGPMKAWLSETWTAMDGEEPDQDFLEYILVSTAIP